MSGPLQFRRGTAATATTDNPTLAAGEPGFETDSGLMKVGNGSIAYHNLPYYGILSPQFHVNQYGADPTGTSDSTAAFVAAYAAAAATLTAAAPGADVVLGPGTYKITTGSVVAADVRIGLLGPGARICQINASGTGVALRHWNSAFSSDVLSTSPTAFNGRKIGGFTLDGTNTTGASTGIRMSGIQGLVLDSDLVVQNFDTTGAIGFLFDSTGGVTSPSWMEGCRCLAAAIQCTIGWCWDGGGGSGTSFDYTSMLGAYVATNPGQNGFVLRNTAIMDSPIFQVRGNLHAAASGADSTFVTVGTTGTDGSRITNALLAIQGEADGSGSNIFDFAIGAEAGLTGDGSIVCIEMGANTITGYIGVSGAVATPSLAETADGASLVGPYGGGWFSNFPNAPTAPNGIQLGNGYRVDTPADGPVIGGGSGAPTVSAATGAVYFRTDALTTSNERIYVNTSTGGGGTTWTGIL